MVAIEKGLIRRVRESGGFLRNVVKLISATAFSQLVVLAAMPVLTRLYTPEEYGVAAAYGGIVGLIVVIATFRYELAIPLPRSDRGAQHVAVIALIVLTAVTVSAGLASPLLYAKLGTETYLPAWAFSVLIVVGVATAGAYQITNYWAVRKSKFGAIARTRIQQGVIGAGGQLTLGLAGFGAIGLILGHIVGQCAGLTHLAAGMIADCRKFGSQLHRRRLAWAAKRYRRFPLYDSWAGLLNVAGGQAPVLLFATLNSPTFAGYYALAYRVLSAPAGLVGNALSQVLLPRIVEANRRGNAETLMLELLRILAMMSLLPFSVVAVVATDIVPVVFGVEWASAAAVVAWTAVWVGWQFICSPLSVILIGIEAQRLNTALQAALLVMRVSALLIGAVLGSAEFALVAFSVASMIGYAGYTLATGVAVGLSLRRMMMAMWRPAMLAGTCLAVVPVMPHDMIGIRYGTVTLLVGLWSWSASRVLRSLALTEKNAIEQQTEE